MNPKDELLTTKGVTSEVKSDGEVIGHVVLMDYDGGCNYDRVISDASQFPGATAVFESSPGSWHVWNTTVCDRDGAALRMLSCKCDPMHISVGYRRGRWTIRFGAKTRVNASAGSEEQPEPYKSAPELMDWWVNETDEPQSRPHINLLRARIAYATTEHDAARFAETVVGRCPELVGGEEYRGELYFSMTDELKTEKYGG